MNYDVSKQIVSFKTQVLKIVRRINRGKTMTYSQVANLAGNKKAARAVGRILNGNYDTNIPCHRVIRANDTLGGYNRGVEIKLAKLKSERAIVNGI